MDAPQRAFDHATQHRPARDTAAAASNLADLFARQGDEAQRNAGANAQRPRKKTSGARARWCAKS